MVSSVSLHDSIQEEAEFDGDPTLELIPDERLHDDEQPAWAKKILSCVQPKGIFPDKFRYLYVGLLSFAKVEEIQTILEAFGVQKQMLR